METSHAVTGTDFVTLLFFASPQDDLMIRLQFTALHTRVKQEGTRASPAIAPGLVYS